MDTRFLVWNSTGLPDARRALLNGYIQAYNVDVVILIEGGQGASYTDRTGAAVDCTAIHERCTATSVLRLDENDAAEAALATAASSILKPNAGVGTLKYYAVGGALAVQSDETHVAYEHATSPVRAWAIKPALDTYVAPPPPAPGARPKRKRADELDSQAVKQTQQRVNFLGHRRPKTLTLGALTVYIWHAPLGGGTQPHDTVMTGLLGRASGGQDALYHNYLFRKHLGTLGAKALILGDLNIDSTGVYSVYGQHPDASSAEGWCHAIAGAGVTISNVVELAHDPDSMSDHAPFIFTATY